ncbi:hypothetical protein MHC_05160 [Mycoplasma haemocanis str. Illinois]|uniref:Uncharacterized protein n=1 Tax=Mycoplasma haemocanis (strain Illinois) TaxID=1111676 RepID=H6N8B4_MYCHN|nr:hypothetical protein [Mycoplasma haemocanis]AEW45886.1 hypothetical protein MHC_05160 [Mycoplasma haemocanis str. Illinois]
MELIQKGIAGTLLVGGVGVTGYYTSSGPDGITIGEYITSKKRELISSTGVWKEKGTLYKGIEKTELISGLDNRDRRNKTGVKEVWEFLKEWCEKTQKKYYTGIQDSTYQSFSLWCLSKLTIKQALEKEGLTSESNFSEKLKIYKEKDEKFISKQSSKAEIDENGMKKWCEEKWNEDFKHEAFGEYARVKEWCFKVKT